MADFRKVILALVALTLLAGLASAQSTGPFQCNAQAAVPPQLRSEGLTELVGDILLTCTGGNPAVPGTQIPTANVTVYLNGTVTSRLLGNASVSTASEALLLVDDPGTTSISQYGNTVPQTICATPLQGAGVNGCTEYVGAVGTMPTSYAGLSAATNLGVPVVGVGGTGATPGPNIFQGVVSGGSVTFYGVPILPPVTSGAWRTFRITNVRINANGITGGGLVPANATASIAISGSTSVPITNSLVTVGYISASLSANVYPAYAHSNVTSLGTLAATTALKQCLSYPVAPATAPMALETLRFTETQGTAFKVRGLAAASAGAAQSIPGTIYSTESGLTPFPALSGSTQGNGIAYSAGYADWGTRLKAVFSNIPSGVALFVSTTNLNSSDSGQQGASTGVEFAPTVASSFAALITGEISPDSGGVSGAGNTSTSSLPLVTQTGTTTSSVIAGNVAAYPIGYAPLTVINGTASAVWEVVNSLPNTPENFDFEVFMTVTSNVGSNVPPAPSTMTVNLSYAPTATQGAFVLASGIGPSATLGIPRFADTSTGISALTFQICQTALLYPYVINVAGFDTGLSIANTTQDPFGTPPQAGSCQIYWYGQSGVPATNPGYLGSSGYQTVVPTSPIAAGTIQSWGTSVVAPGFSGYVIAVCNFQYAHGFAFVSDLGARNLAMGYLAEVIGNFFGTSRINAPADSEQLAH